MQLIRFPQFSSSSFRQHSLSQRDSGLGKGTHTGMRMGGGYREKNLTDNTVTIEITQK